VIYTVPKEIEPLEQGDIFRGLPLVEISLNQISVCGEDETIAFKKWQDVASEDKPVTAIVAVKPVCAIVLSQNCDALRSRDITLCEIRPFQEIEGKCKETKAPKKWVSIITQQARLNYKWYYLPPCEVMKFTSKMAADFSATIRVSRIDLEGFRNRRLGRLNSIASAHFRERIAEYFRRYPYDEWYALDKAELSEYQSEHPGTEPFPWQSQ